MGRIGAAHVADDATILTHCNAGALATGGYGTALGVVRAAREAGKRVRVVACETRPVLQGARLTAWELAQDGFDVTLITDSMVAQLLRRRGVDLVVVGADRIARTGTSRTRSGPTASRAWRGLHDVPFYVAAPWSTVDLACPDGDAIPIERRDASARSSASAAAARSRPRASRRQPRVRRHARRASCAPSSPSAARSAPRARRALAARSRARKRAHVDARPRRFAPKPAWLKVRAPGGERYKLLKETFRARPAHGLRGGALPERGRVLERGHRHHHAPGGHVHPRVPLLRGDDRAAARRGRRARARARGARALAHAAALRGHDHGRPRRSARRWRRARRAHGAAAARSSGPTSWSRPRSATSAVTSTTSTRRSTRAPTCGPTTSRWCGACSAPSATCAAATSSRWGCCGARSSAPPSA